MSKGSKRLSAPWVGAALLGAGVVTASACGSLAENDLFDSGASSGAAGTGGSATMSTSSTLSTTGTSTGQGGDATSTSGSTGSTGGGGAGGGATASSSTASSSTASSSTGGPVCGNGVREAGEQCDDADFGPLTCASLNFSNPNGLVCKVDCTADASGCKAKCGDGKVEPTEQCDDSNTKPGDGCDATCTIEIIMTAGGTCATAIPVSIGLGSQDVTGTTVNGGSHTAQTCTSNAQDRVYVLKTTASGFLTANLVRSQTSFDSVLYLGTGCSDGDATTALLCNDSHGPQNQTVLKGGEVVSIRVQQNQTYYLFVDGYDAGDAGTYQIHFSLSSGTDCNDPVVIPLESGTGMKVLGSNNTIALNANGTCGGAPGGQVIYSVVRTVSGSLDVDTVSANTNYNSVLYARSTCNQSSTQLDCSNNDGTATESLSISNVNGGAATYVYVDGSIVGGGSPSGNYGVTFTP